MHLYITHPERDGMTSKTFRALAAELAALKPPPHDYGGDEAALAVAEEMRCCCARRVAAVCQSANANFDRARFLKAAEVPE